MINDLELELDIRLCLELLEEYNSRTTSEPFDIGGCENDLRKSNHEQVKKFLEAIKALIYQQDLNIAYDAIIKEIKEYDMEWVKNKYELNKKEGI